MNPQLVAEYDLPTKLICKRFIFKKWSHQDSQPKSNGLLFSKLRNLVLASPTVLPTIKQIDLGSGVRSLTNEGMFVSKYQLVLPKELVQ